MAEVLTQFPDVIGTGGIAYRAQACGAPTADGRWEAWVEFLPIGGGAALRSPRETTQPNRGAAEYWSTGLTTVYLEGALQRALHPRVVHPAAPAAPVFDEPAPPNESLTSMPPPVVTDRRRDL